MVARVCEPATSLWRSAGRVIELAPRVVTRTSYPPVRSPPPSTVGRATAHQASTARIRAKVPMASPERAGRRLRYASGGRKSAASRAEDAPPADPSTRMLADRRKVAPKTHTTRAARFGRIAAAVAAPESAVATTSTLQAIRPAPATLVRTPSDHPPGT